MTTHKADMEKKKKRRRLLFIVRTIKLKKIKKQYKTHRRFLFCMRRPDRDIFPSRSLQCLVFSICLSLSLPSLLGIFFFFFFFNCFSWLIYKSILFIPKFDSKIPYSSMTSSFSLLLQNAISLYIPSPSHSSSRSSS